jgi:hypothetical protein
MNDRRMSSQRGIASTPVHSRVARSHALVHVASVLPVASHERPGARSPAPDEDAPVAARREIVDPLWMITGAIGMLFALLALAVAF